MIAAGQLVTRDPIPVRTVYHHQPSLLAQFDRHENRANMANDGCANVGCMHLTSPMVRVWKPKPIGCTPIAPWNLRFCAQDTCAHTGIPCRRAAQIERFAAMGTASASVRAAAKPSGTAAKCSASRQQAKPPRPE